MTNKWYWILFLGIFIVLSDIKYFQAEQDTSFELKFPKGMQPALIHLSWAKEDGLSCSFGNPFAAKPDHYDYGDNYEFEEDESEKKQGGQEEPIVEEFNYRNKIF